MVDIAAEDRSDSHGQQREHSEDGLGSATHVTHVAVNYKGDNGDKHQANLHALLLREVAGEGTDGHEEHDDVLDDGNRNRETLSAATPVGVEVGRSERQIALQHVDGIFLEWENGAVVKHAEQGNQPETEARQDLADVGNLERVVFFFSFSCL